MEMKSCFLFLFWNYENVFIYNFYLFPFWFYILNTSRAAAPDGAGVYART